MLRGLQLNSGRDHAKNAIESTEGNIIVLSSCCFDEVGADAVGTALQGRVSVFSLVMCEMQSDRAGVALVRHLPRLPETAASDRSFRQVLVERTLGPAAMACLLDSLRHVRTKTLIVSDNPGDMDYPSLCEALSSQQLLQKLTLGGPVCGLPEDGSLIADAISRCNEICEIRLVSIGLSAKGVADLASILHTCPKLRTLHLEGDPVGAEGAKAVGSALAGSASIRCLTIANAGMDKDVMCQFAGSLGPKCPLFSLELPDNPAGDQGVASVILAVTSWCRIASGTGSGLAADSSDPVDSGSEWEDDEREEWTRNGMRTGLRRLRLPRTGAGMKAVAAAAQLLITAGEACSLRRLDLTDARFGLRPAVDLMRGVGRCRGLRVLELGLWAHRVLVQDYVQDAIQRAVYCNDAIERISSGGTSAGWSGDGRRRRALRSGAEILASSSIAVPGLSSAQCLPELLGAHYQIDDRLAVEYIVYAAEQIVSSGPPGTLKGSKYAMYTHLFKAVLGRMRERIHGLQRSLPLLPNLLSVLQAIDEAGWHISTRMEAVRACCDPRMHRDMAWIGESTRTRRVWGLARWRHADQAHKDAACVFRAAAEGRPMELEKRLALGKFAGGLAAEGVGEDGACITALEAAVRGGHRDCVRVLRICELGFLSRALSAP